MALAIAACAAPPASPGSDLSLSAKPRPSAQAATPAPAAVALAPAVAQTFSEDGTASVHAVIHLRDAASEAEGYRLLGLPSLWNQAAVTMTLHSPTASASYDPAKHSRTLSFAPSGTPGDYVATASFTTLRPASDYRAELVLTDSAGRIVTARLAGSHASTLALTGGSNALTFTITVNGDEAVYERSQASSNNLSTLSYEDGTVETLLGSAVLSTPTAVALGSDGSCYVSDTGHNRVVKLAPDGSWSVFATGVGGPGGLAFDGSGNLYVAERSGHKISRIASNGVVSLVAGSGAAGVTDGTGAAAQFNDPCGLVFENATTLLVACAQNSRLRRVTTAGVATTVSGNGDGFQDGASALYDQPTGLALDASGAVLIADVANHRVRRWNSGVATTFIGNGNSNDLDGLGTAAQTGGPFGLCRAANGAFWLAERDGRRIRRFDANGQIKTVAGTGGSSLIDGAAASAQFNQPVGVAEATDGRLYIADRGNGALRRLTPRSGYFTVGDQVQVKTGLQVNQPAVDHLDVKLSGACYGNPGSPVLVKRFVAADAASWNVWSWDTTAANAANGANYVPATLTGGAGYNDGQLDFEAYDPFGQLIGKASLGIRVYGKAGLTVRVR